MKYCLHIRICLVSYYQALPDTIDDYKTENIEKNREQIQREDSSNWVDHKQHHRARVLEWDQASYHKSA